MHKELTAFTLRFHDRQRYAVKLSEPVRVIQAETSFFDARQMIEHIVTYSESYRHKGNIHDVGGGLIMVCFPDCFITIMTI